MIQGRSALLILQPPTYVNNMLVMMTGGFLNVMSCFIGAPKLTISVSTKCLTNLVAILFLSFFLGAQSSVYLFLSFKIRWI